MSGGGCLTFPLPCTASALSVLGEAGGSLLSLLPFYFLCNIQRKTERSKSKETIALLYLFLSISYKIRTRMILHLFAGNSTLVYSVSRHVLGALPLPAPTHSLVVPTSCGGGKPQSSKGSCVTGSLSATGKGRDNVGEGTEAGEGERSSIEGQDKESLSRDSGQMTTCRAHAPS